MENIHRPDDVWDFRSHRSRNLGILLIEQPEHLLGRALVNHLRVGVDSFCGQSCKVLFHGRFILLTGELGPQFLVLY